MLESLRWDYDTKLEPHSVSSFTRIMKFVGLETHPVSTASFRWGKVTASVGNYQLCWAPAWQRPSARGCSDLQWDSRSEGTTLTCAQTRIGSGTCEEVPFQKANTICTSHGARLCLPHEIFEGETRGTGCALASQWIWTSQSCGSGWHAVAQLSSRAHKCVKATVSISVWQSYDTMMSWACCAGCCFLWYFHNRVRLMAIGVRGAG